MSRVRIQNTFLTVAEEEEEGDRSVDTHRRARSCDIFGRSSVAVGSKDFYSYDVKDIDEMAKDLLKSSLFHRRQQLAKLKEAMMHFDEEDAEEVIDSCSTQASLVISSAFSECGSSAPSISLESHEAELGPASTSSDSLTWQQISPISEEHANGTCKPCLYFHFKEDGCRQGDDCPFCHLCTKEEVEEMRKSKKMELRSRRQRYGK